MRNLIKKMLYAAVFGLITAQAFAQAGKYSMDQVVDQSNGNYPVMDTGYISSLGMQQKAWNNPMRHLGEGQTKPGYSRYLWKQDVVLPIRLREGMMTLVNFPSWELIETVWIGDQQAFMGEIASPNSLMLYPGKNSVGVDSNLVAFGRSGNRYAFYLRSETFNTERITHSIVDIIVNDAPGSSGYGPGATGGYATGNGPTGGGQGAPMWAGSSNAGAGVIQAGKGLRPAAGLNTASNAPINWLDNIPVNPDKFRFDIDIFIPNPADVEIAPEHVWRDDVFTYIDLGQKALSMNERPIVNLMIQESESPVGFRTKGPHGRLIVVEAVGDMVLRNGKRIICLKLRRDPEYGLDKTDYADDKNGWYVPGHRVTTGPGSYADKSNKKEVQVNYNKDEFGYNKDEFGAGYGSYKKITQVDGPDGSSKGGYSEGSFDYDAGSTKAGVSGSLMGGNEGGNAPVPFAGLEAKGSRLKPVPKTAYEQGGALGILETYDQLSSSATSGSGGYVNPYGVRGITNAGDIAVELGVDGKINSLEKSWDSIYDKNKDILKGYEPYFSVDSKSNATGKEQYRLRIGPIEDVYSGDALCKKLGRRGVKCSVVRIQ